MKKISDKALREFKSNHGMNKEQNYAVEQYHNWLNEMVDCPEKHELELKYPYNSCKFGHLTVKDLVPFPRYKLYEEDE